MGVKEVAKEVLTGVSISSRCEIINEKLGLYRLVFETASNYAPSIAPQLMERLQECRLNCSDQVARMAAGAIESVKNRSNDRTIFQLFAIVRNGFVVGIKPIWLYMPTNKPYSLADSKYVVGALEELLISVTDIAGGRKNTPQALVAGR